MNNLNESPQQICSKILEQLKKSGEFDKYRREIVEKLVQSEDVQILFDQCKEIVDKTVGSASELKRCELTRHREFVRNEIKRRKLVDNALNTQLPLCLNEVGWRSSGRIAEICRAELGINYTHQEIKLEPEGTNLDPIDMEVSSGTGASSSSSSDISSSRTSIQGKKRSSNSLSSSTSGIRRNKSPSNLEKPAGGTNISSKSLLINDIGEDDNCELLDRFADSVSSTYTSSLSCNASEENSQSSSPAGSGTADGDDFIQPLKARGEEVPPKDLPK